ncbi:MAG: tRNA (N(6)-L-threonylcarbamoyladenosine(37)-C(2))-methylthiotransferase MtaB [Oscillospiraceae bacterium]|jgi:threonylcarbamoyladenosine tRNA methylthiotransferase MtaB|nr:tRNA (N(6)-L-threonylcarbamoyladenosine(37)-C(2))-methylthiotransferase MtaB [Oscillospiraceae bacterium]
MIFFIQTLGCKVNKSDSAEISDILENYGFVRGNEIQDSSILILNSCAVTSESVRKTRQIARKFRRINPESVIILTGCAAQTFQIKNLDEVDIILGINQKNNIPNKIFEFLKNKEKIFDVKIHKKYDIFKNFNFKEKHSFFREQTRAFLKIEDGCENFCSYCIIPKARGFIKSKPISNIKLEAENLYKFGFKEIVLIGINLCAYGQDINSDLAQAIEAVNIFERIRLGSLEPNLIDDKFIEKISNFKNLCPHFHISLQSGSNKILKLMRRKYTKQHYINIIKKLKNNFENVTFTTDLIVGFPGETNENFQESLELIEDIGFIKVNVFPFSARLGTPAYNMPEQIDEKIKKERVKNAIKYSEAISKKILSSFNGKTFNVLFESQKSPEMYFGYSENYIKFNYKSNKNLYNKILKLKFDI